MWVPGHSGIKLNEKADQAARSANETDIYIDEEVSQDLKKYFKLLPLKGVDCDRTQSKVQDY